MVFLSTLCCVWFWCTALRSGYRSVEGSLPKQEDIQGAAQGLMRLQDVYALRVEGLVRGHFQRLTNLGNTVDIYQPHVSIPLSGDDCFLVGKVSTSSLSKILDLFKKIKIVYIVLIVV